MINDLVDVERKPIKQTEAPTEAPKPPTVAPTPIPQPQIMPLTSFQPEGKAYDRSGLTTVLNVPPSIKNRERFENFADSNNTDKATTDKATTDVWEFDKPNPWSKIVLNKNSDYPYEFYIKLRIPSLNDLEAWKQVVPNIEFDPRIGALIIPSKDEASALALANLIAINFTGQMSLNNILEKRLIQISVAKAKNHEVVQTKLREQLNENLYGKTKSNTANSFEKDLARKSDTPPAKETFESSPASESYENVNFQSEEFKDTFQHFSNNEPEGYDGGDFSYL
jgi:hypothetical protein